MTKFGDKLGCVEIDFFIIIDGAIKSEITPTEIDAAYRAAWSGPFDADLAARFNKRARGDRGLDKVKNIDRHLAKMREVLVADPDKRVFTAAKEVLENVPPKERPTPQHLTRKFKENKKAIRNLKVLRVLKPLLEHVDRLPDRLSFDERDRKQLQWLFEELQWLFEELWTPNVGSVFGPRYSDDPSGP